MKTRNIFLSLAAVVGIGISTQAQTYIGHTVNQPALLVADAGTPQNFCLGDSVTLGGNPSAVGGTASYTYAWSPSLTLNSGTAANPHASPTSTTTYVLNLTDANGCSDSASVTVNQVTPVALFSTTSLLLAVNCTDLSVAATTWNWDFGDGMTSTLQSPGHTYGQPGTYIICLTINGGTNCQATACDTVNVIAVGVQGSLPNVTVRAYPNPVTGNEIAFELIGNVALAGDLEIRLFDVQGREVLQYTGASSESIHRIQRRSLAAGTYGYRVEAGGSRIGSGKIVLR